MTTVNPEQQVNPDQLAETILNGTAATESDALALLATPDAELFGLVHAGSRLRREHFGMTIKLNHVVNLKSGMCPESCTYCSWPTRSSSATTSPPRAAEDDLAMISDNGFTILGQETGEGGEARTDESAEGGVGEAGCCSDSQTTAEAATHTDPVIRRRGAGTAEVANA